MIIRILMQVLADRVLVVTTLFLNFALFAYAVYAPDNLRFATAGMFSITVFIPVLKLKGGAPPAPAHEEREAA
jgi:hypothetical protein